MLMRFIIYYKHNKIFQFFISIDNIRMASAWNMFTKKIFEEGRKKNKSYSFREALSDASKRKGEMGSMSASKSKSKSKKAPKSKKAKKSTKKTRKARKSRKA